MCRDGPSGPRLRSAVDLQSGTFPARRVGSSLVSRAGPSPAAIALAARLSSAARLLGGIATSIALLNLPIVRGLNLFFLGLSRRRFKKKKNAVFFDSKFRISKIRFFYNLKI